MLVLTRKSGQSIQVGDVTITLLKTSNNRVRIGIEAPKEVAVVRTEKAKAA